MIILLSQLWLKVMPFAFALAEGGGEAAHSVRLVTDGHLAPYGRVARVVVVVLLIMSVYSIAIMVERYLTYTAAKKQSREFAPRVAQALKNDRIEEAINISATSIASRTWRWSSAAACRSFALMKAIVRYFGR